MGSPQQRISDPARLAAVRATGLLDAPPSAILDALCAGVANMLDADAALVTLLDEDRQWFAGAHGLDEPWATSRQTDLPSSLCQHIPAPDQPLAVLDLANDRTFAGSGAAALGVGSYLGYPVCSADGDMLGAVCAIRRQASSWSDSDHVTLRVAAVVCERLLATEAVVRQDPAHELAMVAHDIRNPLTVLRGVAALLADADDRADRERLAAMIDRASGAVDALVEDLLTAGVPTRDAIPLRRVRLDLVAATRSAIEDLPATAGPIGSDLHGEEVVYADPLALTRMLRNLIDNARRHGEPPIEVRIDGEPEHVTIEVANRGPGVPAELRPHLFTRFRPGTASSGSGLGLHIVQRLAAAHGGTVRHVHDDGVTRMQVVLPRRVEDGRWAEAP